MCRPLSPAEVKQVDIEETSNFRGLFDQKFCNHTHEQIQQIMKELRNEQRPVVDYLSNMCNIHTLHIQDDAYLCDTTILFDQCDYSNLYSEENRKRAGVTIQFHPVKEFFLKKNKKYDMVITDIIIKCLLGLGFQQQKWPSSEEAWIEIEEKQKNYIENRF